MIIIAKVLEIMTIIQQGEMEPDKKELEGPQRPAGGPLGCFGLFGLLGLFGPT